MRMVYKIVLGMLLFNAFITFYSPLFNACVSTPLDDAAMGVDDANISKYNPTGGIGNIMGIIFSAENFGAWGASAVILAAGMVGAFVTKNYVYIGVALFVAIVIGLYIKMSAVISKIGTDYGAFTINGIEYNIILGLMTITGIAIGLLVVFSVVDMFAPASARE